MPVNVPRLNEVRIDWVVLAFALLLSILTGVVFGLAPALHLVKGALSSTMREGGRGSGYSTKTGRLRDVLIVSELAFAVILMVGAGLLLRTVRDLLQEDPGFNLTQVAATAHPRSPDSVPVKTTSPAPWRCPICGESMVLVKRFSAAELNAQWVPQRVSVDSS